MPILPVLSLVFVGIGGADTSRVDKQVGSLLHKDAAVETAKVPAGQLRVLARHGDGARAIVRGLHADGVVGGELVESDGRLTLRMVVYDGNGKLEDLVETPLERRQLGKDDIEALRSNLMPDVVALARTRGKTQVASEKRASSDGGAVDEFGLPVDVPTADAREIETPDGGARESLATHAGAGDAKDSHDAAPTETADASDDAVSADEAMQLGMGSSDDGGGGGADVTASADAGQGLRLRAAVGFGLTGRGFSPGPSTVSGYSSAPVGNVRLDASIAPTQRTALSLIAERALGMTTDGLMGGPAPTSLSRWQIGGSYALTRGKVEVAPLAGIGERVFSIDSSDPARSPDGRYSYFVIGASVSTSIGSRFSLGGLGAVEPVVGGAEATDMALGAASRWALELGAAAEYRVASHLFLRGAIDWQRFSLTWDAAGTRPGGTAVDSYPSGTLSLGANY